MRVGLILLCLGICGPFAAIHAEEPTVSAGPMVGHATPHEVNIWVRTSRPTQVAVTFWPLSDTAQQVSTERVDTSGFDGRNAHLTISNLAPGQAYGYHVRLGPSGEHLMKPEYALSFQTPPLWHRRPGGPPDFVVATGSCAYTNDPDYAPPGTPYGGGYEIYETIHSAAPDLMLWLGDNIYLRPEDWGSRTGIFRRYARQRTLKELQPLLGNVHHYALWDDHDYGPNDSDWTYVHKGSSLDAFREFWLNPSYGLPETAGIFTQFSWGDVDFFLLDNRYHRTPVNAPPSSTKVQYGEMQLKWLIDALTSSKATFKIVAAGGQFLSPFDRWEGSARYPHERDRLLNAIVGRKIEGVVFVSGDRHHTELVRQSPDGFYPLYDFTSSPLTSKGASASGEWESHLRVPGTLVTKTRNFGLLKFSGPKDNRVLTIETRDIQGQLLWSHTIRARSLSVPDSDE